MSMGKKIKEQRKRKGLTQEELAEKLGLQKSAIAKYENGRVENIKRSVIAKMAEVLECTPSYLMDLDDSSSLPHYENIRPLKTQRLPVLGEIAAGKPIYMNEEREVYVETEVKADYLLIARGNSMTGARINDGDIVFIREQPMVENGEIAAVAIGDEATLKRFYYYKDKGMLILKPANPDYEDQIYSGDELDQVHVLGKAVYFQSMVI